MKIRIAYNELKAITGPNGYISVSYEITRNSAGVEESGCSVFIRDRGRFIAKTFKEVLNIVREEYRRTG